MTHLFLICRAAVAVLIFAMGAPLWAAEPLTLAEAQRIAVGRSGQLLAQDALALAAREQAVAAGQLPDPILKFGIDNMPANGPDRGGLSRDFMTMRRIGIAQEIPRAEKRELQQEKFVREAGRVQALRQLTLANVQQGAAMAWLDSYYAQAQHDLLRRQVEETGLQVQAADSAFRGNRGSQADVFAARAAVIVLQDRLSQIDRQLRSAALMLARWVGVPAAERPISGSPPWQSTPLQDDGLNEHLKRHPDLLAISAEIDAAETDARLAQANKKSDWSVEASYAQRGPAFANLVSIGVSIPLQWNPKDRQDRELAARLARVDEAKARYDDALRKAEAEVRSLINEWQTGKDRLVRFREELIPTTRQRTEAALTGYRAGKGDLASALAARRDEIEVRLQALTLEMETARAWAQLNFLIPDQSISAPAKDQP